MLRNRNMYCLTSNFSVWTLILSIQSLVRHYDCLQLSWTFRERPCWGYRGCLLFDSSTESIWIVPSFSSKPEVSQLPNFLFEIFEGQVRVPPGPIHVGRHSQIGVHKCWIEMSLNFFKGGKKRVMHSAHTRTGAELHCGHHDVSRKRWGGKAKSVSSQAPRHTSTSLSLNSFTCVALVLTNFHPTALQGSWDIHFCRSLPFSIYWRTLQWFIRRFFTPLP